MMVDTSFESASDVDIVIFIIEATKKDIGKGDSLIIEKIKKINKPTILVINKIDLISKKSRRRNSKLVTDSKYKKNDVIKKEDVLEIINNYKDSYDFKSIIPISAEKNEGLDTLINEVEKLLPIGPRYYENDEITNQTQRQIIEEIIREKSLKLLDEEIPHGIFVEIQKMSKKKTMKQEPCFDIEATIYCSKNSHKAIIIGKNGEMLKRIGTYSRQDVEKLLETKVNLKLWVKIKEDWLNASDFLNKFKN